MIGDPYGRVLSGDKSSLRRSAEKWAAQSIDEVRRAPEGWHPSEAETTLSGPAAATGPGTFFGRAQRTLVLKPSPTPGWRLDRQDLPRSMPIRVSVNDVWTTARNIVLCTGSPHNYVRMVEHIIALKVGLGLDRVTVGLDSGDPPLFDLGSMDLVEAAESAEIVPTGAAARFVTVKEPVSVVGRKGSFLTFLPPNSDDRRLTVDCLNKSRPLKILRIWTTQKVPSAAINGGFWWPSNSRVGIVMCGRPVCARVNLG